MNATKMVTLKASGKPWEHSEPTTMEDEFQEEPVEEPPEINRNLDGYLERIVESMREGE
jgi:uncharacterized protein (DUF2267 family)